MLNASSNVPSNLRVFYASGQPYTFELALLFYKNHKWNPVYWLVGSEIIDLVKSRFCDTVVHRFIDSVKGRPADAFINESKICVDPTLLHKLSDQQITAFHMMNRNDSHTSSFSFSERSEFFRNVLNYWFTVIKKLKIDLVVFEEEPHQASDYILYVLCGEIGVQTLMPVRTIVNLGLLPVEKFEHGCIPLVNKYKKIIKNFDKYDTKIDKELELYFEKLNGDYESILDDHLWDQVESVKTLSEKASFVVRVLNITKLYYQKIFNYKAHATKLKLLLKIDIYDSDQKQKRHRLEDSNQGYFELFYYRLKAVWQKKRNLNFYKSVCSNNLNLTKPYILCGLQYQPEKSTCPLGGYFVDQIYMVELLSSCLPLGWYIYVKEHPSQFVPTYTRYGECRDLHFYEALLKIPNVKLVSLKNDSFTLIDKAQGVASVGGTMCWEAIARGKPALCFGDTWFKACHGVFPITSKETLKNAYCEILHGFKPCIEKVKLFAKLVRDINFNGAVGGVRNLKQYGLTSKKNADVYYRSFCDYLANISK